MNDAILDLIDDLYDECVKNFPEADRESFTEGAQAIIMYLVEHNKL